ncbi:MAG: OmpW family outer membrane protein, partial [Thermoanaerobaculia bacterium]
FHLTSGSNVDFYIGPFLGYVQVDDVTHRVLGSAVRIPGEDEVTWGAQIGLDVPASSTWAFTAGIKYLELSYDLSEGDDEANEVEIGLDPLIFTVGVAYRF